jgi:hypothetical protein
MKIALMFPVPEISDAGGCVFDPKSSFMRGETLENCNNGLCPIETKSGWCISVN